MRLAFWLISMSKRKNKKYKVIYSFDPEIPDWEERLGSVYEMLFRKVEEMETQKRLRGVKREENYGGQFIPQF